ncbi:CIA30 family protein [Chlorobaculum thiosulfatiphilum]|uniref:CIA30 family protein n=1 Tax=Chlorobaculum thiosulfatiphilum TaxID=115852 RepID=A0A5C4S661_CHLTI|nr:CIA30 family protein [Chlorobaculum thiosulfatiphilum]TNJ38993.1 CIA30 family protein [Chlorobaculum thiosulfatiphilum]
MLVCDFRTTCLNWMNVDDVVMGGVSDSAMRVNPDGTAVFAGNLSLENSGGFASVRTVLERRNYSGFDGFRIRAKGDGKRYSFRARNDDRFDGIVYKSDFDTAPGEWREIELPFAGFTPTFRGRTLDDVPPLDSANIAQIGLLISNRQAGVFRLEVEWIEAY